MEIRALRWSDFEAWAQLDLSRYEELRSYPDLGLYTRDPPPTLADLSEYFGGMFSDISERRAVCNVADVGGGELVGHASVFPRGDYREIRHIGSLGMMVRHDWRGRGVGGRLLRATLDDCRGIFELVELSVVSVNEPALALYRSVGFEERGRTVRTFKRGDRYLDEVLMSKSIDGRPM